jgi:hypothetical protein
VAATAVRSAAAVEPATTVETTAGMRESTARTAESTTATEAAAYRSAAGQSATPSKPAASRKSAAFKSAAFKSASAESTATVVTATAPASAAPIAATAVEAVEPGSCADKDAAYEPIRSVVAVRGACIRRIIIVSVSANRCRAIISAISATNSDANRNLSLRRRRQCKSQNRC